MKEVGYFTHPDCKIHQMGHMHPENPMRLRAIDTELQSQGLMLDLIQFESEPASLEQIERAHSHGHVRKIEEKAKFSDLYMKEMDQLREKVNQMTRIIKKMKKKKRSEKKKNQKQITDYYIQGCAYAVAHNEMYGTGIQDVAIIMTIDGDDPIIFEKSAIPFLPLLKNKSFPQYSSLLTIQRSHPQPFSTWVIGTTTSLGKNRLSLLSLLI